MRKAVMIVLALLAIRLLPKALRREARALELLTVLFEVTLAAAANTSKAVSTEQRTAALEVKTGVTNTAVAKVTSQAGTVIGHMNTVTDTVSGACLANDYFTTGPQIGGAAAHYHQVTDANGSRNTMPVNNHTHYLQLTGTINTIITQVNSIQAALTTAGLI